MKIKIPKKLKIGAIEYEVNMVAGLKLYRGNWGEAGYISHTIDIDNLLPDIDRMATYIHEALHVIDSEYVCGIDEDNIERLGNGVLKIFQQLGIEFDWSEVE